MSDFHTLEWNPTDGVHDNRCESEWESGAMAYTPCGCLHRANLMSDDPMSDNPAPPAQ